MNQSCYDILYLYGPGLLVSLLGGFVIFVHDSWVIERRTHNCTATFMLMPVFFASMCYSWYFERWLRWVLEHESSATTPFYCLKFAPFCGRHSFLCIVAVCWWKNEAYTDWYYSILLLSVIINSVTFVTDDFIFAKMESITKLLDKNVAKFADISKPFLTFPLSKCRILWNFLFLQFLPYLLLSLFT